HVGDGFDVAILTGANDLLRVAADRGGDEHAVAPDDRAGDGDAVHGRFPRDVLAGRRVPLDGGGLAVGNARRVGAAEGGPVLCRDDGTGGNERDRECEAAHDYFPSTRVKTVGGPPAWVSVKPVTLSPSTLNEI